ncbi:DEDDh 3'-5' exonuclease [Chrysochromulina ericina virus CeV-01B]|uniref:DEDDh 3'-5' exonuclease n=1 Tax=Chrysochromulina ericina virus CeV-01B TaxID=3070830 RepID=A0A0N9R3M9_9VIRU|nr:DNA polymerase exonuclease subunit [Chrysochromulina ericina virus]ALH23123.1 DEDDh 3'-5' exonuclease [Chrysochromulina ericina virus CeV-01B]
MKILIFDTETSGLPEERNCSVLSTQKWPYILQLSYILYDTEENIILTYVDTLIDIDNNVNIDPESINIHKITKEICKKNGKSIKDVLTQFNYVLNLSDLLIGHNLEFDKNILIVEYIRNKLNHNFNPKNIPIPSFCTMKNSKSICQLTYKNRYGKIIAKYPKLLELYKHYFNTEPDGLHNAMTDVIVTFRCYYKMQFNLDIFECSLDIKKLKDQYLN